NATCPPCTPRRTILAPLARASVATNASCHCKPLVLFGSTVTCTAVCGTPLLALLCVATAACTCANRAAVPAVPCSVCTCTNVTLPVPVATVLPFWCLAANRQPMLPLPAAVPHPHSAC